MSNPPSAGAPAEHGAASTRDAVALTAAPPRPAHERLAAVASYGIMDTPPEPAFDDIVAMAAQACGMPMAMLSIIAAERRWLKAATGSGIADWPAEPVICIDALAEPDMLLVPDLAADPRYAAAAPVAGPPFARFYAGVALRNESGVPVGVLCVAGDQPGQLSEPQRFILRGLARTVMAQLEQRKALAERQRREHSNRQIIDSAVDYAIIGTDLDGLVTRWNEGARRIFGWGEAEMLGQPADRIFTPEDHAAGIPAQEMADALAHGPGSGERWHLRQSGSRFFAAGEMMTLKSESGEVIGFIKIVRDHTEQRRAVRVLRDSQERIETALGTGLVAFFDWDVANQLIRADERFAEFFGLDAASVLRGVPVAAVRAAVHPVDQAALSALIGATADGFGEVSQQLRVAGPGQPERHLLARGRCYERNGLKPLHYTGIVVDITAAQQAEAALRANEALYSALFNSIDAGFCVIEVLFDGERATDYRFVEVNAAFTRQTGLAAAAGKRMRELVPGHEDYWFEMYGHVALSGAPARFESQAAALDGRWFSVYAFPVGRRAAHRIGVLFNDITEARRVNQELTQNRDALEAVVSARTADLAAALESLRTESAERARTEEQLRQSQKMEAVGQLTGGLAHDFNNLLTGITGSLELLKTRIGQGRFDELDRYISMAQTGAGRAAALTHRLLAFSRRQTLDPQPIDANRLVMDMEELVRRTAGPGIAVSVVGTWGLWLCFADPGQLENALLNLCLNARDAMPDAGKLVIETANLAVGAAEAAARDLPVGQYVVLSVRDTGAGMAPEVLAKAFDPFFTTKPLGQGTGLGLSMIYGFVKQSGGHIRIHSDPGEGTLICIYLPRHGGAAAAPTLAPAAAAPAVEGETVLVVDDEASIRLLAAEVLEELGYATLQADTGSHGLELVRSPARIDLLVTDVGLPGGMNGRQLADAARQLRPGLRVLFITGYAENTVLGDGDLEPGMHVLTKPFLMDALAGRIRHILAR